MLAKLAALFIVAVGLVAVLLLAFGGADLQCAARTGPRWKRRLIAAGLGLLGGLAAAGCADRSRDPGTDPAHRHSTDQLSSRQALFDLSQRPEWRRLAAVWTRASKIAAGERGAFPFDQAGKDKLSQELDGVNAEIQALRKAGMLSPAEADLLGVEREHLIQRISELRPTELRLATCYEPMAIQPAEESLRRLSKRLPLLADLARSNLLRPEVLARTLDTVERDLETLEQEANTLRDDAEREKADRVLSEAKRHLEMLREQMKPRPGTLEAGAEWQIVIRAWRVAVPLARTGESTTPQREAVDRKLDEATGAITDLVAAGELSEAEADLLVLEAQKLRSDIYRRPPNDPVVILCYSPAFIVPAQVSLGRIEQRLPLLKSLAQERKVHPSVLRKILPTVREDLATLADPEELKLLQPDERGAVPQAREQAQTLMKEIEAILQKQPS